MARPWRTQARSQPIQSCQQYRAITIFVLRLEAHGPVSVRRRCVFPTDPSFIRLLHQNTNFLMTEALRQWTKLPIPDLSSFLIA